MNNKLVDRLQVWGFEDHFFIFKDASLGICLKLNPLDISCKDDDAINQLHQTLTDFLNGLSSNLSLQFVQEIVKSRPDKINEHEQLLKSESPELVQEMVSQRVLEFKRKSNDGELTEQNNYLFVRQPFSKKNQKNSFLDFFRQKKENVLSPETIKQEKYKFSQVVENLKRTFETSGILIEAMEPQKTY